MMFKLNLTENINKYLKNIQFTTINNTVSFYFIDSIISLFLINSTFVFFVLSSDLKLISLDVFYTNYTETSNIDSKSYRISSMTISSITILFTITSHTSTAMLYDIAFSTANL